MRKPLGDWICCGWVFAHSRASVLPQRGCVIQSCDVARELEWAERKLCLTRLRMVGWRCSSAQTSRRLAGMSRRSQTKADRQSASDQPWAEGWNSSGFLNEHQQLKLKINEIVDTAHIQFEKSFPHEDLIRCDHNRREIRELKAPFDLNSVFVQVTTF